MAATLDVSPSQPPRDEAGSAQPGARAGQWWAQRTLRERQLVVAAVAAVVLFTIWLVLVQPALRTLREAPLELDRLDQQLQQMQLAAAEAQALRGTAPVSTEQATAALRAATERLGSGARVAIQGDRATVTLVNVDTEALRAWLGEVRSGARARPIEAQLVKSASGYGGTVTLAVGGSGSAGAP
jgi:general secretion pathway protein M